MNKLRSIIVSFFASNGYSIYRIPHYAIDSKYLYFQHLYNSIRHLDGDIVECGVGYGRSLTTLTGLAQSDRRRIFGFDSFEGFPEPAPEDVSPRNPKKGEWAVSTPESIRTLLKKRIDPNFVDSHVQLVKGFFEDTVKEYNGSIALLHLDGDLYQSYKICLEELWPKVVDGGVVLFDEYLLPQNRQYIDQYEFPGAIKAIDEFFGEKIKYIRFDSTVQRHYIYKQD